MPVQEFECQIARGQIGRYLNGEALSSEGLRQLGIHVAECSGCKEFLDHRKAKLQGVLGEAPMPEARAVVEVNPSEALIAQIRARSTELEPEQAPIRKPKPIITKPLLACGALALVLVGMTYISRNPTAILGPSAAQAVGSSQGAASQKSAVQKPASQRSASQKSEVSESEGQKDPVESRVANDAHDSQPATSHEPRATIPVKSQFKNRESRSEPRATNHEPQATTHVPRATSHESRFGQAIDPTAKSVTSPISITTSTPKPAAKPKSTHFHRKAKAHRRRGLNNLAPGTGAVHVYTPIH